MSRALLSDKKHFFNDLAIKQSMLEGSPGSGERDREVPTDDFHMIAAQVSLVIQPGGGYLGHQEIVFATHLLQ